MHAVRRAHLYFGLFLLPWAVLYGITGFLFNHPTAFSDAPDRVVRQGRVGRHTDGSAARARARSRDRWSRRSTSARRTARSTRLVESEKAKYTREFAFATVKADGQDVSVLFDVTNPGGTVRSKATTPPAKAEEPAPFAIGAAKGAPKGGGKAGRGEKGAPMGDAPTHTHAPNAFPLDSPLHERVKEAVPVVLARTGFPAGDVTVTSVPDLSFHMHDGEDVARHLQRDDRHRERQPGRLRTAARRTLGPPVPHALHLAHGFPGSQNAKWFWAVVVDAMSFVMVFWGVSGLFMWWQIKATRRWGFLVLLLSAPPRPGSASACTSC